MREFAIEQLDEDPGMKAARQAPTSVPMSGFSERRKTLPGRKLYAPVINVDSVNKQIFRGMNENRDLIDKLKKAKELRKLEEIKLAMKDSSNNFAVRNQGNRGSTTHQKLTRLFDPPFKPNADASSEEDIESAEKEKREKKKKSKDTSTHTKLMNIKEQIFDLILAHVKTHQELQESG